SSRATRSSWMSARAAWCSRSAASPSRPTPGANAARQAPGEGDGPGGRPGPSLIRGPAWGRRMKRSTGGERGVGRIVYVCQECGYESAKWLGRCPACEGWNSLVEEPATALPARAGRERPPSGAPTPIAEVALDRETRFEVGIGEVDRVLGGGLVPGSLILISGDPGIGKSTLVLQVAQQVAAARPVLYVSGEESVRQTKMRASRL